MSLPVATTICGIDTMRVLQQNCAWHGFHAYVQARDGPAAQRVASQAADGRYELYKTTARHEGKVGREQHGFPSDDELTA